jgi:hypothetical protein
MALKKNGSNGATSNSTSAPRENPAINAKIDAYIAENPKVAERLESYTKDRLVRMHVLNYVDRQESIENSIHKDWAQNPGKKEALETLVASVPKPQQEKAMLNLARQQRIDQKRMERSPESQKATRGAKV